MSSIIIQDEGSPTIEVREGSNTLVIETTVPGGGAFGGGDVFVSGTPTVNQVATWTNATTIRGAPVAEINSTTGVLSMRLGASYDAVVTWTNESGNARATFQGATSHVELGTALARMQSETGTNIEPGASGIITHRTNIVGGEHRFEHGGTQTYALTNTTARLEGSGGHTVYATDGPLKLQGNDDTIELQNTSAAARTTISSQAGDHLMVLSAPQTRGVVIRLGAAERFQFYDNVGSEFLVAGGLSHIALQDATAHIRNNAGILNFRSNEVRFFSTNGVTQQVSLSTSDMTVDCVEALPIGLPSLTTTERDALTAVNRMLIYNETTSKVQAYAGGTWVDLH